MEEFVKEIESQIEFINDIGADKIRNYIELFSAQDETLTEEIRLKTLKEVIKPWMS